MIEYFAGIDWSNVLTTFGVFVGGMVVGVCIGFSTGRQLAIERITDYVKEKKKNS